MALVLCISNSLKLNIKFVFSYSGSHVITQFFWINILDRCLNFEVGIPNFILNYTNYSNITCLISITIKIGIKFPPFQVVMNVKLDMHETNSIWEAN